MESNKQPGRPELRFKLQTSGEADVHTSSFKFLCPCLFPNWQAGIYRPYAICVLTPHLADIRWGHFYPHLEEAWLQSEHIWPLTHHRPVFIYSAMTHITITLLTKKKRDDVTWMVQRKSNLRCKQMERYCRRFIFRNGPVILNTNFIPIQAFFFYTFNSRFCYDWLGEDFIWTLILHIFFHKMWTLSKLFLEVLC